MTHLLLTLLRWSFPLLCLHVSSVHSQSLPDTLAAAEVVSCRTLPGMVTAAPLQRIDSADFVRRGITDTGDALRRMAGVNLRDYGGAGGLKTVSVRGLGASHTAVAYDGLCLNDSRQGQVDLQRFSLDRLSGIELQTLDANPLLLPVRNLAAAVVSLTPVSSNDERLRVSAGLRQASFGTWNPSLTFGQKFGQRTALTVGGDWFTAQNDYPFVVENGAATQRLHRTNSKMQATTAEAGLVHQLRGGGLSARVYFYHSHRRLPGQVILYVNENHEVLTEQNVFGQLHWKQEWGRVQVFAAARHNDERSRYRNFDSQFPGGALKQNYRQRETYGTAGVGLTLLPWLSAAYATDYMHAVMRSNLKADGHVTRDTWLQSLTLRLGNQDWKVTARAVGHLSFNHRRGAAAQETQRRLLPSVTASVRLLQSSCRLMVRAGWKESFRLPTFSEAYYDHLGSTSLRPERARQFNLGLTFSAAPAAWWRNLSVTGDAYANRVKDRIVSVPYNLFVWRTVNLGRVETGGLDLVAQSEWTLAHRHSLLLATNYSFQRSADRTDAAAASYGNQLPYMPRHHGAVSLSWLNPWLTLAARATFAGLRWSTTEHIATTRLPAWQEWGVTAFRHWNLRRLRFETRIDLINLFNERYEIVRRYPMPGRAYKLTLKMEWR